MIKLVIFLSFFAAVQGYTVDQIMPVLIPMLASTPNSGFSTASILGILHVVGPIITDETAQQIQNLVDIATYTKVYIFPEVIDYLESLKHP